MAELSLNSNTSLVVLASILAIVVMVGFMDCCDMSSYQVSLDSRNLKPGASFACKLDPLGTI